MAIKTKEQIDAARKEYNIAVRPIPDTRDGIQHSEVRKIVDAKFFEAMHELEECYYGDREQGKFRDDGQSGWKYGKSEPFKGIDCVVSTLPKKTKEFLGVAPNQTVLTSPQAAKLFSELAGLMHSAYHVATIKANRNLTKPYSEDSINGVVDKSRDRLFRTAKAVMEEKFLRALKKDGDTITTFGQLVALWNSIPMEAGDLAEEPMPLKTTGQVALEKIRKMEDTLGIKARDLVGTLPEA